MGNNNNRCTQCSNNNTRVNSLPAPCLPAPCLLAPCLLVPCLLVPCLLLVIQAVLLPAILEVLPLVPCLVVLLLVLVVLDAHLLDSVVLVVLVVLLQVGLVAPLLLVAHHLIKRVLLALPSCYLAIYGSCFSVEHGGLGSHLFFSRSFSLSFVLVVCVFVWHTPRCDNLSRQVSWLVKRFLFAPIGLILVLAPFCTCTGLSALVKTTHCINKKKIN